MARTRAQTKGNVPVVTSGAAAPSNPIPPLATPEAIPQTARVIPAVASGVVRVPPVKGFKVRQIYLYLTVFFSQGWVRDLEQTLRLLP